MQLRYFDSHAHLDDTKFSSFDGGMDAVIKASVAAGVCGIINVGTNIETSKASVEIAHRYPFIYAAVGIYPTDAQRIGDRFDAALHELMYLLDDSRVVAVGEIGLDYHYDDTDREVQKSAFEAQMKLACELGKPVVIHDREAHGDVMDIIRRYPSVCGVMHSFSGSPEMAAELVKMGWYISFSGPVTYKNAVKVKAAACSVPQDRILVETDSPYLPPTPHRGEVNYPGYVALTLTAIAELRKIPKEDLAAITVENTKRFFGITDSL